jgi:predicted phosphodiesterase
LRIKFIQCGDLHLDSPFTSLADIEGKPDLRRQDLKSTLARIVDLADTEKADALLICGDLYEHGYIRKSTVRYICDQFNRIPGIHIMIIPGNHDPAVPESFYCGFEWPGNVHIMAGRNRSFELPGKGAVIHSTLVPPDGLDPAYINILMYHGTLDMPFSNDAFQPVKSAEIAVSGYDYCALGHFHTVIFGAGPDKNIFNAGSPEPLGFDEEGKHGAIAAEVLKTPGAGTEINAGLLNIGRRQFFNLVADISACLNDEQTAETVITVLESSGSREHLYRVSLCGHVSNEFRPDTEILRQLLREKAFYIKLLDRTVPDYDFDTIAGEPGLKGLFVRKMLDRAAAASGEEERQLVMQALYYGMEAIDEGKVCI